MNKIMCFYSNGHDCCTHQHYCIFNKKTWELMIRISKLEKDLQYYEKCLTGKFMGCYVPMSFDSLKLRINSIENDLNELKRFENKILNKEIKGYGYEVLELEGV